MVRDRNFPKYVYFTKETATHELRDPANNITYLHYFIRNIPGINFKFISYLEVEILRREVHPSPVHLLQWKKLYPPIVKHVDSEK